MFIAIKIVSRVVRPPRLFLRIPKDPKTSAKANFEFQRHFKFFSHTSNPTFTFSREQLLGLFAWKLLLKSQNFLSWKREGWIWSARKNFWNNFGIQNLLSKTSLGPWVSAETTGVAVRHVKRFLGSQVCGGGDFLILKLWNSFYNGFWSKNGAFWRFLKITILKEWWK